MNREELVREISLRIGSTKTESNKFLNSFMDIVQNTLAKGDHIILIGFGKFYATTRKAGKGKNPRTGEPIDIKACNTPKFKPGKKLKLYINK